MTAAALRDLGLAARSLARRPGAALVSVAVLGLALGAATAVYGVVDAVLLRPLPWKDPDRLVLVHERQPAMPKMSASYPDFVDWQQRSRSWSGLGGFQAVQLDVGGGGVAPEHVSAWRFSAQLLPTLGVEPRLGRNFAPEEDRPGGARVALLGDDFWRRHGADPRIVGKAIRIRGEPHTIVGVLPPEFRFYGGEVPVAVPLAQLPTTQASARGSHPGIYALGRLAPGVSLAQARSEMEEVGRAMMSEHPQGTLEVLPALVPAREELVDDVRAALLLLLGAVGCVVLVAIANVSSLSLARGLARRKELAIRAALGADRGAIVRQLLAESVLVAVCGGALGLLVALWGVELLSANRPASLPDLVRIRISAPVLAFAFALSLAAGVLSGLVPALTLSEPDLHEVLKAGDAGAGAAGGGRRARAALVTVEVAVAFVLVAGAAMSARALVQLGRKDPGFDPTRVLTLSMSLPPDKYGTPERLEAFRVAALAKLATVPGVERAALSDGIPVDAASSRSFDIAGRPQLTGAEMPFAIEFIQTPGFLETLGVPLLAGRAIDARDRAGATKVTVVDEALARKFFPDHDPIGQRIVSTGGRESWEIVGVARHVAAFGPAERETASYQLHMAFAQLDADYTPYVQRFRGVVRTSGRPEAIAPGVRAALAELEPDAPVYDVEGMERVLSRSLAAQRFSAALLSGFGAFALLLAAVGLFGLVSHAVARRTREIGVRIALGATPEAVVRMVLLDGARHVAAGLALGVAGSLALARVLAHLVVGAGGMDVVAALAAGLALAAISLAACWIPARRAVRVDPAVALRAE